MTPLLVAVGAALGAALRLWVAHHLDDRTPWRTLAVNVAGSFTLGLLVGSDPTAHALAMLGTGFCGGLTTYSAFAVQTRDQGRDRGPTAAMAYSAGTIALALAACALGFLLAA